MISSKTINGETGFGSPVTSENSWEIVSSPLLSPSLPESVDLDDQIVMITRPPHNRLVRQRSSSTPDLFSYQRDVTGDSEEISSTQNAAFPSLVISPPKNTVVKKSVPRSFRDMVLSQVDDLAKEVTFESPKPKLKVKPKIVVTPIRRCTKSTPNLSALVDDDGEVLGETDAMEFYNRKAMGHAGRQNGMKIRPDEAKRKDFIIQKKQLQRDAQKQN